MRRYLIFAAAGLSLLMYSIDTTAVAVAFPNFIKDFGTSVLLSAWTIAIYYIALTMALPLAGNFSDVLGRKRVFLIALALFTGSSLACGRAPNIYALIGFRFLQGIGGAAFMPTASGIVAEHFPENRESAIGLFTSIYPLGGLIGPNLGGWIVSRYSWHYIFYINLPIGIVLIILILTLLSDRRTLSRPPIDFAGAFFMSGGVVALMVALSLTGESFSVRSLTLAGFLLVFSFFLLFSFFRREKRVSNPIMDLSLLESTPFLAANVINLIIGSAVLGFFDFLPYYAISVHRLSTLMSGMVLTPRSVGVICSSVVASLFLRRWGYRQPIIFGLGLVGIAVLLLAPSPLSEIKGMGFTIVEALGFLIFLTGIATGVILPAANNACIELMPDRIGSIVGLRGMFRTIGGALGVSLVTVILHLSANQVKGFQIVFFVYGFGTLCSIPLVFLMPAGRAATRRAFR